MGLVKVQINHEWKVCHTELYITMDLAKKFWWYKALFYSISDSTRLLQEKLSLELYYW